MLHSINARWRNPNHPRPRGRPRSQGQGEAQGFEAADRLLFCVLSQPIGEESVPDGHSRPPEHRFPGEEGTPIFTIIFFISIDQKVRPGFRENDAYRPLVPLWHSLTPLFLLTLYVREKLVFKGQAGCNCKRLVRAGSLLI